MLCFLISVLCPGTVVSIFTSDPTLKEHAAYGLKTMNLAIGIISLNMVASNFYQNIGMVKQSIILSLSRQLLVLVPLIYILPRFFQEAGVWYSFPISDIFSLVIAIVFLSGTFKKLAKLKDGE